MQSVAFVISLIMLLLGIDLGTSSVKVSVVSAETQETIVSVSYPEQEADIISLADWLGRTISRCMVGAYRTSYTKGSFSKKI